MLSPLGFLLFMMVMFWAAMGLEKARSTSRERAGWTGPHKANTRYAITARYLGLAVLGAVVFLGGWSGPVADGAWWTLVKAAVLIVIASMFAAAMPRASDTDVARAIRNHWLPLAAINLVVVAAVMEVMA